MPIFNNATVTSSEQVWASPDGQRKLFNVTMTLETGQSVQAKSWSERLVPGFKGDLETYEKAGKQGMETFVRQAPKEGGFTGGGFKGGGSKAPTDPFTMYLSYAKDILVAMLDTGGFDQAKYDELLQAAIRGGHTLHDGRPGAEQSSGTAQTALPTTTPDVVAPVTDEPFNINDIPF